MSESKRRNLKLFLTYGIVFEMITKLYKPFSVKFIERVGGNEFHISLFNSLPGFVMLFTILPGIILLRRMDTKRITEVMMLLSRVSLLGYVIVPFLPNTLRPWVFILVTAFMAAPLGIYTTGMQSLTADLFDLKERAEALGRKNKYSIVAVMVTTFITGQMLTFIPKSEAERLMMYQFFFLLALFLSYFEYKILSQFTSKQDTEIHFDPLFSVIKGALANKRYMIFVICSLIFHFGWQMGWPLFSIYTIKVLGANESWMSIISISSMIVMFGGHSFWPKMIERHGNAYVTAICTIGMGLTPLFYVFSRNIQTLVVMAAISGIFTSGTITVLLSDALEVMPKKNRMIYMGLYMTGTNLTLTVAPLIGHYFLEAYSIQVALIATTAFRLLGGFVFLIRSVSVKKKIKI